MPFADLAGRVADVRDRIAAALARGGHRQRVRIIAVTKTHGPEAVRAAVESGIEDVGENRVQEALSKMDETDVQARWHLIGHLQRNKVRALGRFQLFHALDSSRLADAVHDVGTALDRPVEALVQVNVAGEATKGGFTPDELPGEADRLRARGGVRITGVMTIAPLDADERALRAVFAGARKALAVVAAAGHPATELSMGMSNDYEIAVEEGATCVRLGTVLFGTRET